MIGQLRADGVSSESFRRLGVKGATREAVVTAAAFSFARVEGGFELSFELPSGAYATTLLRELFVEVVAATGVEESS